MELEAAEADLDGARVLAAIDEGLRELDEDARARVCGEDLLVFLYD